MPDRTELTAWIYGSNFMVEAFGTEHSVAEVGEQFAWLGAALRCSPFELGVAYSVPFISEIRALNDPHELSEMASEADIYVKIDFVVQEKRKEKEKEREPVDCRCWHSMFRNPVVVQGYPIRRRSELDTGLEIPLNMMAGLIRSQRANTFNGKLFIKSYSAMLILTRHSGDLLLWHFLHNKDGERISYLDDSVSYVNNVSAINLEQTRHVVGWCSGAKNYAGKS